METSIYIKYFDLQRMSQAAANACQSSCNEASKLIICEHFRICKAKFQKRKFIQRQNKQELKLYKQKMLRLVRKRSQQSLEDAQRKIEKVEEQLTYASDQCNIRSLIDSFERKIREPISDVQEWEEQMRMECDKIHETINFKNNEEKVLMACAADRIEQICLESILR